MYRIAELKMMRYIFNSVIIDKLINEDYAPTFYVSRITKEELLNKVENDYLKELFHQKTSYPRDINEFIDKVTFKGHNEMYVIDYDDYNRYDPKEFLNKNLSLNEKISLIRYTYRFIEETLKTPFHVFLSMLINNANKSNTNYFKYSPTEDYIYISGKVKIEYIKTLEDLSDNLMSVSDQNKNNYDFIKFLGLTNKSNYLTLSNENVFFRGHSNSIYRLIPSIVRENWIRYENEMFSELLFRNHEEFKEVKLGIDILKKMQHYNLPTRLLDITRSMLVALYFAVENNDEFDGEIVVFQDEEFKYGNSDTVSILSALPSLNVDEKNKISNFVSKKPEEEIIKSGDLDVIDRLIDIIRREKPGFICKIKSKDLYNPVIVVPTQDNPRMVKQNAAFIICALNDKKPDNINGLRIKNSKNEKPVFIIKNKMKDKLRKKLSLFGFDKSTLFPEIDIVADFIKLKYKNKDY